MKEEQEGNEHQASDDMDAIEKAIKFANKYKLRAEVLCWAFYAIRGNKDMSVAEALEHGLSEWDV